MTERFLHTDPPTAAELAACAGYVRSVLPPLSVSSAIGVAGTVTSAAALDLGLTTYDPDRVHRHPIPRASISRIRDRLAALPLEERRQVDGLDPDRAPVILGGMAVLAEIVATYDLAEIVASERDILHGAALAAAAEPA
jgi:exopolyphosphatase/guanosine-5'-triphosphate,3'-diphosphate pyrophosphatase